MQFGIKDLYKKYIDAIILQYPYAFFVYGSRSKGTEKKTSDLDLCIIGDIPLVTLGEIKERLNNSMLPFTIDVVAWNRLSNEFKEIIKPDLIAYIPDRLLGAHAYALHHKNHMLETQLILPNKKSKFDNNTTSFTPCSILSFHNTSQVPQVISTEMIEEHEAYYGPIAENSWLLIMHNNDILPEITEHALAYFNNKKLLGVGFNTFLPTHNAQAMSMQKTILDNGLCILENLIFFPYPCSNQYTLQLIPLPIEYHTIKKNALIFLIK